MTSAHDTEARQLIEKALAGLRTGNPVTDCIMSAALGNFLGLHQPGHTSMCHTCYFNDDSAKLECDHSTRHHGRCNLSVIYNLFYPQSQ